MSSWNPLEDLGGALIAMSIGAVGWIMSTFTKRHIESMDKLGERVDSLSDKVGTMSADVAEMKANIGSIRDVSEKLDRRVTRLEEDR